MAESDDLDEMPPLEPIYDELGIRPSVTKDLHSSDLGPCDTGEPTELESSGCCDADLNSKKSRSGLHVGVEKRHPAVTEAYEPEGRESSSFGTATSLLGLKHDSLAAKSDVVGTGSGVPLNGFLGMESSLPRTKSTLPDIDEKALTGNGTESVLPGTKSSPLGTEKDLCGTEESFPRAGCDESIVGDNRLNCVVAASEKVAIRCDEKHEDDKLLATLPYRPPQVQKRSLSPTGQFDGAGQNMRCPKTAKELAAEAIASDLGGWLTFDPNLDHPSGVQSEAEEFLAKYPPSRVTEVHGSRIHWIHARAPWDDDEGDDSEDEDEDCADPHGLCQAWEKFLASGQQVTFEKIKKLAVAHRCLVGKWLIMKKWGPHADITWERIFQATIAGRLGISTKVSSALNMHETDCTSHVFCVYSSDFTDTADVMELEGRLRSLGIRCKLTYKPDVFTYLGVYRRNEWGLKPTIYSSEFDVRKGCSTVVSVYE